ncbi:hypothetical protein [Mesomycoplasma hyorhinis]|uniref:hypothetical protein n=1 Tax=Mesomycoplasma hyorhinis TaxID=2100 RepID=UPI0013701BFE|nr:hypothetical protein [Mesomycoplasma hyorhinis]MXR07004.1 hypothetical protein [Mesomycoplasma hyorhinis]UVT33517.1 hypothetical protein NV229_02970 [Mesomycoplasma hyorhinis]UVT34177.1 hypothetical protein NV230_02980 [Mesomycoplasma hyorhinis]
MVFSTLEEFWLLSVDGLLFCVLRFSSLFWDVVFVFSLVFEEEEEEEESSGFCFSSVLSVVFSWSSF